MKPIQYSPACRFDSRSQRLKSLALVIGLLAASNLPLIAAEAAANWEANCTPCHGKTGSADTKMGKVLGAKKLSDPGVQATFTDAQAAEAIRNGVKRNGIVAMKSFGDKLTDDEIKALVAYVRTLKK